ncbi:hypothetical protein CONPUDRAFT_156891 [Coniophora puteana RWD-64-598 SS2]|uniref:Transmembrane protein n=1 Tax=Coniophora puteana (strain RWD-64-598) TaxID=741705 RepID=A0A5M3MFD5_CONPW|nr:uncharacterized protein CONPUDRAFT_156891 [Coniophora puteana RWD-64-598 SS2]EIW77706.1 hypothetical protein CONPUDRAFT_156891 [Coniophora puteana RWD-64-598 SS2]
MVAANFLLDDKSPLILYGEQFLTSPGNDYLAASYYLGTYTVTDVNGTSLTWSFNGTAFAIYGVRSANHGAYAYSIDGGAPQAMTGDTTDLLFQQPLVQISGLQQGTHTVELTNLGTGNASYLDVDMITFQSDIGGDEQLVSSVIQDWDSRFQYSSGWDTNPMNVSLFNNASGHVTTGNEHVSLSFTGKLYRVPRDFRHSDWHIGVAVSLYGSVGPNNGQYQVQLDGASPQLFNGTSWDTFTQVMLYQANDIGDSQHEITVYNAPEGDQNTLAVDFAEVLSYISSTNDSAVCAAGALPSSSSTSQKGLIAGLVVTTITALLGIISALYLLRANRKLKQFQKLTTLATQEHGNHMGPFFRSDSVSSAPGAYIPASAAVVPSVATGSGMEHPSSSGPYDAEMSLNHTGNTPPLSPSDARRRPLPVPSTTPGFNVALADAPPLYH